MASLTFPAKWAAFFAAQAALAIAAGAFGAHALNGLVDERALGWWHTGSQYLMYHSLAGLLVAALSSYLSFHKAILSFFFVGNVLFAGSLYVMTLTGQTWLGVVTPLGGICYLLGWLLLVICLWRAKGYKE
ncbi:DUF423 domain-containing protein [Marinomonas transparens]|uniref:DUF423 domain-containing protein n=1 Tax=Marinomonas transparens TaxID=2795388 RepID=A0A934JPP6_9GAMM|nr:DUF423 domain-containing protein [Marinomonas transparens]MBJ7537824.1 DUF423 domain-containing protein [Marinomonas transparens]